MHVVSVLPLRSLMLTASATRTSLAVQFSFCLATLLYSSCKQVLPANAGVAKMANASSANTNKNVLLQFVRQFIFFSSEIWVAELRSSWSSRLLDAMSQASSLLGVGR